MYTQNIIIICYVQSSRNTKFTFFLIHKITLPQYPSLSRRSLSKKKKTKKIEKGLHNIVYVKDIHNIFMVGEPTKSFFCAAEKCGGNFCVD